MPLYYGVLVRFVQMVREQNGLPAQWDVGASITMRCWAPGARARCPPGCRRRAETWRQPLCALALLTATRRRCCRQRVRHAAWIRRVLVVLAHRYLPLKIVSRGPPPPVTDGMKVVTGSLTSSGSGLFCDCLQRGRSSVDQRQHFCRIRIRRWRHDSSDDGRGSISHGPVATQSGMPANPRVCSDRYVAGAGDQASGRSEGRAESRHRWANQWTGRTVGGRKAIDDPQIAQLVRDTHPQSLQSVAIRRSPAILAHSKVSSNRKRGSNTARHRSRRTKRLNTVESAVPPFMPLTLTRRAPGGSGTTGMAVKRAWSSGSSS